MQVFILIFTCICLDIAFSLFRVSVVAYPSRYETNFDDRMRTGAFKGDLTVSHRYFVLIPFNCFENFGEISRSVIEEYFIV